jgi:hypothetical protein
VGVARQQGNIEHGDVCPDEEIRQDAPTRPAAAAVAKRVLKGMGQHTKGATS